MSIQTFKKKGVARWGANISGKAPGGIWVTQGPFGNSRAGSVTTDGPQGFSINGGRRSGSYIGQSMAMSKHGTPYRGVHAQGWGGTQGRYPVAEPLFNMTPAKAFVEGIQAEYIKPSVLSNRGMLRKKYRWAYTGGYPVNWVQPVYPTGSLSDNASQLLYIQTKAAANICVNDVNKPQVYEGNIKTCKSVGCVQFPYTKTLYQPQTASQYTLQIQRKCANPVGPQKPFPFATNGGTNNSNVAFGAPPAVAQVNYLTPPAWYWNPRT